METIKALNTKMKILLGVGIVLFAIVVGSLVYYFRGISPVSSSSQEVTVDIPKNTTGNQVITLLNKKGLIHNEMAAKIHLKMNDYEFKSNTYLLNKNMSLQTMLTIISDADRKYISNTKFTLLDGETIPEYVTKISKATKISEKDILDKWEDQTYLKKLIKQYWFLDDSILDQNIYFPLEGYLAPETYQVTSDQDSVESITTMLLDQTDKQLTPYKSQMKKFKVNKKALTTHEFISLCSVVQRESPARNKDRQLIAGVLINRLNKPMRLQSDVTANYANQVTKVAVTYKDLNNESPYNTYRHDGLPVGPISSISQDVIKDVLKYKKSDYYFFFSTKENKVLYAETFEEHKKIVAENKWY